MPSSVRPTRCAHRTRLAASSVACLATLLMLTAPPASAGPAHGGHDHSQARSSSGVDVHVRVHRSERRVRRRAARRVRRRVAVVQPPPVVVRSAPVVVQPAPVAIRTPRRVAAVPPRLGPPTLSLGVHGVGLAEEGLKLGLSDLENPALGGVGLSLNARLDHGLGLELKVDVMGSDRGDFDQLAVPVLAALTWRPWSDTRIQPYLLAGGGVQLSRLDYMNGAYTVELTEGALQAGLGVEVFLTPQWSLKGDVRGLAILRDGDSARDVAADCAARFGGDAGLCRGVADATRTNASGGGVDANLGLTFQLGAAFHF